MPKSNSFAQAINISSPTSTLTNSLSRLKSQFEQFSQSFNSSSTIRSRNSKSKMPAFFQNHGKKISSGLLAVLVVASLVFAGSKLYSSTRSSGRIAGASNSEDKPSVEAAVATLELNQELTFPLRDNEDTEVSSIKYDLQKAEIRNEIIVEGRRYRAIEGRSFLIVTLKITNNFNQAIEIDTRDYMRLIVDNNQDEKLAPEIHNDPVEVQAISVKYTRLGFTIDEDFDSLQLQLGEINSEKTNIDLNFN